MRALILCLALAGCATTPPGIEVRTVTRTVEVAKPCPVVKPSRPVEIKKEALPTQAQNAVLFLYAALLEWQGEGKYGDQAEAALETCIDP